LRHSWLAGNGTYRRSPAVRSREGQCQIGVQRLFATFDGRYKELDVHAQVAADALAVRHHAAEALLRLAWARLASEPITGPRCLWAEIATGPRPIEDVITRLNDTANAPNPGEVVHLRL
jgi:hypothetical protein